MIAVGVSFEMTAHISIGAVVPLEEKSCKPDGSKLQAVLQENNSGQPLSKEDKKKV